jgi:dCMP deaminase
MSIAHIVSNRSNCIKQKVGAIIVKNNRILSTGYNGTPSKLTNCYEGECPRCNSDNINQGEDLDKCFCIHAEENALLEIGKSLADNATLYTTVYPCLLCSKLMIQCGITKVVYDRDYKTEHTDYILSKGKIVIEKWKKKTSL